MIFQNQLAQPVQGQTIAVSFGDLGFLPPADINNGLLGNRTAQTSTVGFDFASDKIELTGSVAIAAQPARKLALLKAQRFTEKGRQERIAASLAALNAPQPIHLTVAQWKEVVEEIEDED